MTHYVYILQSESVGKHYCGETQNIEDRIERHNLGISKSTKSGIPWKLIRIIEVVSFF